MFKYFYRFIVYNCFFLNAEEKQFPNLYNEDFEYFPYFCILVFRTNQNKNVFYRRCNS